MQRKGNNSVFFFFLDSTLRIDLGKKENKFLSKNNLNFFKIITLIFKSFNFADV